MNRFGAKSTCAFPVRIRVGKAAWPIVRHRLEAADSIAESFTDVEEGEADYGFEEVAGAAKDLLARMSEPPHEALVNALEAEILVDCLEGSTFFGWDWEDAVDFGQTTEAEVKAEMRAGREFAKKLSEALGRKVELNVG